MCNRPWWKFEIAVISLVLLAVAGWLLVRVPEIIEKIGRKHPELSTSGWFFLLLWLVGYLVLIGAVTRLCKKKKWSRSCYTEGIAAGALYLFLSPVLYILLRGQP